MADTKDWMAQFKNHSLYHFADTAGLLGDLADVSISTQEEFQATLKTLAEKINTSGKPRHESIQSQIDEILTPQPEAQNKAEEKTSQTKDSLTVNGDAQEEPVLDNEWIEEKRQFWEKEFAPTVSHTYTEEDRDNKSKTSLKLSLEKDGVSQGTVEYTSPTSCKISKDSKLVMYQGLVADAIKGNLSLTFGPTLDDTQKLMLFAAVLTNKQRYEDGGELEVIDAPKLDEKTLESDAFKAMDPEAQAIIKLEIEKQLQETKHIKEAEEIADKLKEVRQKLNKDATAPKEEALSQKDRENLQQEKLDLMKKSFNADPNKEVSADQEAVERSIAARFGILRGVKDSAGNEIVENKVFADRKRKQNPQLEPYLIVKYGKEGK